MQGYYYIRRLSYCEERYLTKTYSLDFFKPNEVIELSY